jgi:hypothetical protein
MEKDFEGTLKAVKDMGYDYVEFAGFFGKSADEVKEILDRLGLTAISVHEGTQNFNEKGHEAIDYLKAIGVKYCAIPWYNKDDMENKWDEMIADFKSYSKALKDAGIKLLYHNHDFEFEMYEFVIKYKLVYYLQEKVQKIFIINMIKNLSKNKERLLLLASFIQSIIENPYDENTNESKFILLETLLGMKVNLYKMKLCKLLVEKNDSRLFDLLQKYEDNESIQLLQNRQILSNYY